MSSSVFFESISSGALEASAAGVPRNDGSISGSGSTADANLVVVYGKNGINFDRQGLESLIAAEEKALSSISVIRLTSPTPSMEAEDDHAEAERLKDLSSDGDSGNEGESACSASEQDVDNRRNDSACEEVSNEEDAARSGDENESEVSEPKPKRRGRKKKVIKNIKMQKFKRRQRRDRPEIVGLNVDDFYPTIDANVVLKAALQKAGITTLKQSEEYKFQLYIIHNDHCYTPYTSPEQMKAQQALRNIKGEVEKQAAPAAATSTTNRKFVQQSPHSLLKPQQPRSLLHNSAASRLNKQQRGKELKVNRQQLRRNESDECIEDDEHIDDDDGTDDDDELDVGEEEEESEFYDTEESLETDNDRDSDLDFNINNRKGRKRKMKLKLKRQLKKAKRATAQAASKANVQLASSKSSAQLSACRMSAQLATNKSTAHLTAGRANIQLAMNKSTTQLAGGKANVQLTTSKSTVQLSVAKSTAQVAGSKSTNQVVAGKTTAQVPTGKTFAQLPIGKMTSQLPAAVKTTSQLPVGPKTNVQIAADKPITQLPATGKTTVQMTAGKITVQLAAGKTTGQLAPGKRTAQLVGAQQQETKQNSQDGVEQVETATQVQTKPKVIPRIVLASSTGKTQSPTVVSASKTPATATSIVLNKRLLTMPTTQPAATLLSQVRRGGPIVQVGGTAASCQSKVPASPQSVKEIVINKALASPKGGGFTDIRSLLDDVKSPPTTFDSSTPPTTPYTALKSSASSTPSTSSSSGLRCFTPLALDAASKHQLPAQISLQTHQSTSELLAAENDKQLDLIDAIVNDELKSAGGGDSVQSLQQPVNIPELVKMLESTEQALEQQQQHQQQHYVGRIDGDHRSASLDVDVDVDVDEVDELTDDLLQQVVELIEDDKSLQAAVEQQAFGDVVDTALLDTPIYHQQQQQLSQSITEVSTLTPPGTQNELDIAFDTTTPTPLGRPIQIVRGNGRVITLPPIEAPTTRAKRRLQSVTSSGAVATSPAGQCPSSSTASLQFNESSLDSSLHSSSSLNITVQQDASGSSERPAVMMPNKKRRTSKEDITTRSIKKSKRVSKAADDSVTEMQTGDDDDPNKLWCVCRQPHNNRFMICCDSCEDWFHGTCVNITKVMGLEMEQKSIDWTCPKCKEKKQRKITDMLTPKSRAPTPATTLTPSKDNIATEVKTPVVSSLSKLPSSESKKLPATTPFKSTDAPPQVKKLPLTTQKKSLPVASPSSSGTPQTRRFIVINKADILPQQNLQQQQASVCIVCKRPAQSEKVYCGDECIRRHAQNALQQFVVSAVPAESSASTTSPIASLATTAAKSPLDESAQKRKRDKGLFEDLLLLADRKPRAERVHVYERRSGRVLTGTAAPTTHNLKKWLQENPSFEVVQPGSRQALEIERRQRQRQQQQQSTGMSAPTTNKQLLHATAPGELSRSSPNAARPGTPKQAASPQKYVVRGDKCVKPDGRNDAATVGSKGGHTAKRQTSESSSGGGSGGAGGSSCGRKQHVDTAAIGDSEPIRLNVRRTLKEQLLQRINDEPQTDAASTVEGTQPGSNAKLTPDEVENFVNETEIAMYAYFNRDTGAKYKAKYRSLMFNIKDRKNRTLLAKICARQVEPRQLVRMSPEELASQELAQWREKEAKHQLEMITKSELELLSCAKHYVLKTHKGEELEVDEPPAVVEDVACVLNNVDTMEAAADEETCAEIVPSVSDAPTNITREESPSKGATLGSGKEFTLHKTDKHKERRLKSKERHHHHSERQQDKGRTHGKHSSHSHSRSRSRSRSRERQRSHKSSSGHGQHKERERGRARERDKAAAVAQQRSREWEREKEKSGKSLSAAICGITKKSTVSLVPPPPPIETFSLIDQILESTKTIEEAANLVVIGDKEKTNAQVATAIPVASIAMEPPLPSQPKEQAPTPPPPDTCTQNEFHAQTRPLWSGAINMIDVASFQVALHALDGNMTHLSKLLPRELDVVGRIGPDTVWDYIAKIRRSPNKEIVMLRLLPASVSQVAAYGTLYEYLDQRERLGVIKTSCSHIKDFYIYPLGAEKSLPTVLQSDARLDFFADASRIDVLIGIVIRVIGGKRSVTVSTSSGVVTPMAAFAVPLSGFAIASSKLDAYTSPDSPQRKTRGGKDAETFDIDAIIKAPITAKISKPANVPSATCSPGGTVLVDDEDGNEPYSPGGGSDDDVTDNLNGQRSAPPTPIILDAGAAATTSADAKLQLEELNRKIAISEMEIAGLLNVDTGRYAPTATATVLANISIPSNLSQILASIKSNKPDATIRTATPPPPPLIGSLIARDATPLEEEYAPVGSLSLLYEPSAKEKVATPTTSRLAQLTEAELLSLVPDDMLSDVAPARHAEI